MSMENPGILAQNGHRHRADRRRRLPHCLSAGHHWPAAAPRALRKSRFEGVTIQPARTLQLEDRIGSLEPGKDADIAIFDGHPFSSLSACRMTIIDGKIVHNTL